MYTLCVLLGVIALYTLRPTSALTPDDSRSHNGQSPATPHYVDIEAKGGSRQVVQLVDCDNCEWLSPMGALYDLTSLCGRHLEVTMETPSRSVLHLGVCSTVPCGDTGEVHGCLHAPGNPPTSTGSTFNFEQIEKNDATAGVRVLFSHGEYCSAIRGPRKTIVNFECDPLPTATRAEQPKLVSGEEGQGLDVCTYKVVFRSTHGCPAYRPTLRPLRPAISAVSGCIDSIPRQTTYDCHPAGGTEMIIYGVDFELSREQGASVNVQVGGQDCGKARVLDAWRISCQLPPGVGEGHSISATLKINKGIRFHGSATPEVYIEEQFISSYTVTVSYKPLVDYQRQFDSFLDLGVGGLTPQIQQLYQRAFATRSIPASVLTQLGIDHAKGILLYGPPGSGKTLLARTIANILKTEKVTLVNAPEIMSKYLGESEKNLRSHFDAAEKDWQELGDVSDLHVIIIDEIDAICKPRGKSDSSAAAAAYDSVVNQLLTKMDGLRSLHNIMVIGMTNRRDMIDPALMRPGRFEIQIEIGLPDETGRWEIFTIHTREMKAHSHLSADVDLRELARNTSQFSGAEIAGLVRLAASYALGRRYGKDSTDTTLQVRREDFQKALEQFKPAYTHKGDDVKREYLPHGFISAGPKHADIIHEIKEVIVAMQRSPHIAMDTVLLYGDRGVGKSGMAAHITSLAEFTFVKVVKAIDLLHLNTNARVENLMDTFHEALKSSFGLLILDDLHLLVEAVQVDGATQLSNTQLHTIMTLLSGRPSQGHQLLVIGTLWTGSSSLNENYTGRIGLQPLFSHHIHVTSLNAEGVSEFLGRSGFKLTDGWPLDVPSDVNIALETLIRIIHCVDHWLGIAKMARNATPQNYFDSCLIMNTH